MKKMVLMISWFFNPPYHVGKILVLSLALLLALLLYLGFTSETSTRRPTEQQVEQLRLRH